MNKLFERTFKRGHYEYGYLQGNLWLKVFYHSYENKALFAGEEEAKYTISNDKYSIFANITDAFKVDNKFEFIIHYPDDNVSFRWFQNKNPIDELETSSTTASGFEDRGSTVQGFKWGGLVKTNLTDHDQINSFLNGNPGHYYWYFAIGMYDTVYEEWKNTGIPSYYEHGRAQFVYVWMRLPFSFLFRLFDLCSFRSLHKLLHIDLPLSFFSSIILSN